MRFIAGLIALAGAAGLVGLFAPLTHGVSLFPAMLEGDGAIKMKAIVLVAAFALALVLGIFAITKERMSRLHSVCTLVGFAAASFILEIWQIIPHIADGIQPSVLAFLIAIGLGLIGSIMALVKARADY